MNGELDRRRRRRGRRGGGGANMPTDESAAELSNYGESEPNELSLSEVSSAASGTSSSPSAGPGPSSSR